MGMKQFGRYEVLAELGRGAMGVVYKAADPILNRIVAIKTINLGLDLDERDEYAARFQQEAKAVGSLNHPAIVTLYDMGQTGDVAYMAMEYLDGRELRDLMDAGQTLPIKQAIAIATQVAAALAYAHRRDIVHRDIKPANIMVLKDGTVKITDFGIARMRVSELKTQTGMRLGSPRYMSPEQVLGLRVDHRADVFSLGVVLYEMLTNKAPFGGNSLETLMYQTVHTVATLPSRLNPAVPEMLDLILAKMLEKLPENRYPDAAELATDLRECERIFAGDLASGANADLPKGAPDSLSPAPISLDKTMTLAPEARTRRSDAADEAAGATLGLSAAFDSFAATQRLAREVGADKDPDLHAATVKLARSVAAPADAAPAQGSPAATIAPTGGGASYKNAPAAKKNDMLLAIAMLVTALVVAGLIAFL